MCESHGQFLKDKFLLVILSKARLLYIKNIIFTTNIKMKVMNFKTLQIITNKKLSIREDN